MKSTYSSPTVSRAVQRARRFVAGHALRCCRRAGVQCVSKAAVEASPGRPSTRLQLLRSGREAGLQPQRTAARRPSSATEFTIGRAGRGCMLQVAREAVAGVRGSETRGSPDRERSGFGSRANCMGRRAAGCIQAVDSGHRQASPPATTYRRNGSGGAARWPPASSRCSLLTLLCRHGGQGKASAGRSMAVIAGRAKARHARPARREPRSFTLAVACYLIARAWPGCPARQSAVHSLEQSRGSGPSPQPFQKSTCVMAGARQPAVVCGSVTRQCFAPSCSLRMSARSIARWMMPTPEARITTMQNPASSCRRAKRPSCSTLDYRYWEHDGITFS